jgi:hypothetical protein
MDGIHSVAKCAVGEYQVDMSPSVYGCKSAVLDVTLPTIQNVEALQPACMGVGKPIISYMAETSQPLAQSVGNCPVAE